MDNIYWNSLGNILAIICFVWNSLMALVMIPHVFAPMSNGFCEFRTFIILFVVPWWPGLFVPWVGGIGPGLLTIVLPFGIGIFVGYKKEYWGCQYGNREATPEEYAEQQLKKGD